MKFSIIAVALPLIAGTSAAPSTVVERQSPNCEPYNNGTSAPFPHELVWGEWFLCCSYNGPDPGVRQNSNANLDAETFQGPLRQKMEPQLLTRQQTYQNCCDRQGAGTGSGFPGCVEI